MSGKRITLFAVFAALIMITAVPVEAQVSSNELVVGSQHTDFGTGDEAAPQSLVNLSVNGSGTGARVELATQSTVSGSASVGYTGSSDYGDRRGVAIEPSEEISALNVSLDSASTADTVYVINNATGAVVDSASVTGGDVILSGPLQPDTQYRLVADSGGQTYTAATNFSFDSDLTTGAFNVTGGFGGSVFYDTNVYNFDTIESFDVVESGSYVSATHSVTNPEQAAINITQVSNVSVEATVRTDNATVLNQTTISSTGNHTLALANTSSNQLETVLDVNVTGNNPQFELANESILFENNNPIINNSSATPNNESINDDSAKLSINLSDPQFGTAQGEELTVKWFVDGSQVDTTIVNSNGTASTTVSGLEGGNYNWHVVVTDSYGLSTTSQTFSLKTTAELYIYNESDPDTLIKENVSVEVTFFEKTGKNVFTRSASNGVVNMTGLDTDSTFIVRASANNYYDRTIIINSLFEEQRVYLLNKSVASVENQFVLNDLSGQFGDEAQLIIQRPLKINGSTSYQRIVAAGFGVTGHTTVLEQGVRYRVLVANDERQRVIGSYLASDAGKVTLDVGEIIYPKPDGSGVAFSATEVTENDQQYIRVRYNDTKGLTEQLQITIHERGNASNVLASYDQVDVQTVMLKPPVQQNKTSWVVNVTADRGDTTFSVVYPVGGNYRVPLPIDATWLGTIGMVILTFITALYQSRLATVGSIIVVLVAGAMMLFQFITIAPMAWWAAASIAVGGHIRATAGGGGGV